jgi:hypothetical protein
MKTNSFDRVMKQIENEFETQRADEVRAERRRVLFARIRKAALVLALLGLCGASYAYRSDIKGFVAEKFTKPQSTTENSDGAGESHGNTTPKCAAKVAINAAQENAKVRDSVIDGMMK